MDAVPPPSSPVAALTAHALRVTFGDATALDGVDLVVTRGALTVIVGPNGAGKSTLLETLAGPGSRHPAASTPTGSRARSSLSAQR